MVDMGGCGSHNTPTLVFREERNVVEENERKAQEYLSQVKLRLQNNGFKSTQNIKFKGYGFDCMAKRRTFEMMKGWHETAFVFGRFPTLDFDRIRAFSAMSFKFARKAKGIMVLARPICPLECYPVALVDTLAPQVAEAIRNTDPPKHWGGAEIPVAYSLEQKELYYYQTNPLWGQFYHEVFRQRIRDMLAP
jgi:hypothetical protein